MSIAGLDLWLWMIVPRSSALCQPHLEKHHPLLSKVLPIQNPLATCYLPLQCGLALSIHEKMGDYILLLPLLPYR